MTTTMYAELVNAIRRPRGAGPSWSPAYAYITVQGMDPEACMQAAEARCIELGEAWLVNGMSAEGYDGHKAQNTVDLAGH